MSYHHNPDINQDWEPLIKHRVYRCCTCGHEIVTTTNHTGCCYPTCKGKCRKIVNPNTSLEIVLPKQTKHEYVKDAD